tara:strand:- start:3864 stop:4334 length:471 start_codon:yes stop_codon:yes gene_type:complete
MKNIDVSKLKINLDPGASFEEVSDSIYDVLQLADLFEDVFEDGFKYMKLLELFEAKPIVQELLNDVPTVFVDQFQELIKQQSKVPVLDALRAAKERLHTSGDLGKVATWAIRILANMAHSYGYTMNAYKGALAQKTMWENTFKPGDKIDLDELLAT